MNDGVDKLTEDLHSYDPNAIGIYVMGPFTADTIEEVEENVRKAMELAVIINDSNKHFAYCPHLSFFLDKAFTRSYQYWMRVDRFWLDRCDAGIRIQGESAGADEEWNRMRRQGKPLFLCSYPFTGGKISEWLSTLHESIDKKQAQNTTKLRGTSRHHSNKQRWSLVPWDVLDQAVTVMTDGYEKHHMENGEEEWKQGHRSEYFDSVMRHLSAYARGEESDADSGMHPLDHAIARLMFLRAQIMRGIGSD